MRIQTPKISIVLVRPQFAGNLGSVARAMKNMGLVELRLVQPVASPQDSQARQMAAHAKEVLAAAKIYDQLIPALHDFDLVVGTSRRKGRDRSNWSTPRDFALQLHQASGPKKVAILFGAEDTGLTNEEISCCQQILTIPSHPKTPSLNLAQAVIVVAYEIFMAGLGEKNSQVAKKEKKPARLKTLEGMYTDLQDLLLSCGFLDKKNPDHMMRLIRNMLNRARLQEKEVRIWRGICRQLRWWARETL